MSKPLTLGIRKHGHLHCMHEQCKAKVRFVSVPTRLPYIIYETSQWETVMLMDNLPMPVILDTDIGTDIDDTWALAMLLKSPELDLRLVTASTGDTTYRAKLAARILEIAGRTDVPVAVGRDWQAHRPTDLLAVAAENAETFHEDPTAIAFQMKFGDKPM